MPEPQAISKNIIGATQLFKPPNTLPHPPTLFWLQQHGSQHGSQHGWQHGWQQQFFLSLFFDIVIYPPSYL